MICFDEVICFDLASLFIVKNCIAWWEWMEMPLKILRIIQSCILQARTESLKPCIVFHDRIRCVMVCKIGFTNWNAKITLLCASMVITYYIKLSRTGADRHNGILMSFLLLVTETNIMFERKNRNSKILAKHFI